MDLELGESLNKQDMFASAFLERIMHGLEFGSLRNMDVWRRLIGILSDNGILPACGFRRSE